MKRAWLKGNIAEWYVIELWTLLCWVFPLLAELAARRFLPLSRNGLAVLPLAVYLINRVLIAPANAGFYACCRRLAKRVSDKTAATCEVGDLHGVHQDGSLLATFFGAYRHPLYAVKRRVQWDLLRAVCYATVAFPGCLLLAIGEQRQSATQQVVLAVCGILLTASAWIWVWILFRRLKAALILDIGFMAALKRTRKRTNALLRSRMKMLPLLLVPFSLQRVCMYTDMAVRLQSGKRSVSKAHSQIFHTRVLGET